MKRLILFFAFLSTFFSSAQLFDNLDSVLAATTEDAQLLVDAYVAPLGQSLTYSLNSGWASSAKTHKKFGFDLTFGAVSPSVSDGAKSFNPNSLGLKQLLPSSNSSSTIFGKDVGTEFTYTLPGTSITQSITLPGGIEDDLVMNSLPTPYIQAGVGLFFDTDIIIRYIPKIENQGAEFGLTGVALKHNLMQYLGLLDKLPLNVSAIAAYSKMNIDYQLSSTNSNQKITYDVDTFLIQALASLDFPIISVVGGFGYGKGDASMQMLGNYEISLADMTTRSLKDPLKSENTYTGTHALIGLRANLLFLKIFANYTLQEFNTLNAGVSFSFR
jgi:hypothetical protein